MLCDLHDSMVTLTLPFLVLSSKHIVIRVNIAKQVGRMSAENCELTIFTKLPVITLNTHYKDNSTSCHIYIYTLLS